MKKKLLVTGSSGLIGSEIIEHLKDDYNEIYGIDNNQRRLFFGKDGDTSKRKKELQKRISNFKHVNLDIRNRSKILSFFEKVKPNDIIHCAAQPSHDLATKIPFEDFDINATSTLNILESMRRYTPKSTIVYLSTNKVYGDAPNFLKLKELNSRYTFADKKYANGISEDFSIDQTKHSLFGASKLSADIMVQEYGRYFDIKSCCIRGGCLTGPNHSSVELHGFLNFLIKTNILKKKYTIFGYKGKQVRDNIHSKDVASFIKYFIERPRIGEVYNLGGGKNNSISIKEAFKLVSSITDNEMIYSYNKTNRIGDHICYFSDLKKSKKHYPDWKITYDLKKIILDTAENFLYKK